jgi:hypothetical protein
VLASSGRADLRRARPGAIATALRLSAIENGPDAGESRRPRFSLEAASGCARSASTARSTTAGLNATAPERVLLGATTLRLPVCIQEWLSPTPTFRNVRASKCSSFSSQSKHDTSAICAVPFDLEKYRPCLSSVAASPRSGRAAFAAGTSALPSRPAAGPALRRPPRQMASVVLPCSRWHEKALCWWLEPTEDHRLSDASSSFICAAGNVHERGSVRRVVREHAQAHLGHAILGD